MVVLPRTSTHGNENGNGSGRGRGKKPRKTDTFTRLGLLISFPENGPLSTIHYPLPTRRTFAFPRHW